MRTDPDVITPPAEGTPGLEQRGQAVVPGNAALVVLIDGMNGRVGLEQGRKPPTHVKINLRTGKRIRQRLDQRQRQHRIPQKSRIPYRDPLHKAPPFGQTPIPYGKNLNASSATAPYPVSPARTRDEKSPDVVRAFSTGILSRLTERKSWGKGRKGRA